MEHTQTHDEAVWEETLDSGARVTVTIRRRGDHPPVIGHVEIDPPRGGSVDTETLRTIRLAEIAGNAGREIDRRLRDGGTVAQILAAQGRRLGLSVGERIADYRPGRGGRDDLTYARAALRYIELSESGAAPNSTFALGQELAPAEAENWYQWARYALRQAKIRGLYVPHGRGRRGGRLTDKARKLLQEAEDHA